MADTAFWARKRLGVLPQYRTIAAGVAGVEAERLGLPLEAGETLVGVYANRPGIAQTYVAVTSTAIVARKPGGWARMPYATLSTIRFDGGKDSWDVLTLVSADGGELAVQMPGEAEKPVASLAAFLTKVSSARRVFDCAAIHAASAHRRNEWAARVMASPTVVAPSATGR